MKNKEGMKFLDRTAIVTGAGHGIGRAIGERLAEAGAKVAVVDIDRQAAKAVAGSLNKTGMTLKTNVSQAEEVQDMVHAVPGALGLH